MTDPNARMNIDAQARRIWWLTAQACESHDVREARHWCGNPANSDAERRCCFEGCPLIAEARSVSTGCDS